MAHARTWLITVVLVAGAAAGGATCRARVPPAGAPSPPLDPGVEKGFLDTLEVRTFRYFWDLSDPVTGLTPDRWPTHAFASVAATGFALTAYGIGAERGYVTRAAARDRVRRTLEFLWRAPQGPAPTGTIGYHGLYYHFLDAATGERFEQVELSTIDTALLLAGALYCKGYFDRDDPGERRIRELADSLYRRADWTWAQPRPPTICHGWTPEKGFLPYDWRGYDESMLLQILALGSPTHPVDPRVWDEWTSACRWGTFQGRSYVGFAPLFGHQFSHCWIDFRGIRDRYIAARGIDYFENSRRATLAQRAYAIQNPQGFRDYGPDVWGLTACDGPIDTTITRDGARWTLHTYAGRGASFTRVTDDGTIAPTAAGGSVAFAPEIVVPTLVAMRRRYGDRVFGRYGFVDAFNPTLRVRIGVRQGRVDPGLGWFDTDYLGIDQGPILLMLANARGPRSLVWERIRRDPAIVRGLRRAGFTGGWLDAEPR